MPNKDSDFNRGVSYLDKAQLADALLTSALDCIVVSDEDGRILEFNLAAERTFGMMRDAVIGKTMEETIVPHQHRDAHRDGMNRFLTTGKAHVLGRRVELEALHSDGHVFPVELTITEARMGERRYFVANLRDITEQRQRAAQLRESQAMLHAIFDNIPAALYLRDRDDRLVMINTWGANFLGRAAADMIGQPMSKFREPQNVARVLEVDRNIIQTKKSETHEFTYHLSGGDRTGLMTFFPVTDSGGDVSHIGGMLLDVTALTRAQRELEHARASMQAFFDHIPVGIYINQVDPANIEDMTIEFANDAIGKPYGITKDQVIGSKPYRDYGPELKAVIKDVDRTVVYEKRAVQFEMRNPLHGRYELYSRFPIMNETGEVTHIGGMNMDVDDRVRTQLQLDETRAMLEAFLKNVPVGIYINRVDPSNIEDMTMEFANEPFGRPYGRSVEQLVGAKPYQQWGPEIRKTLQDIDTSVVTNKQPMLLELKNPAHGGHEIHARFPILNAAGDVTHVGGMSLDINERVRIETQFNETRAMLQAIFDSVPAELYLRELDGTYVMMNKWGASRLGGKPEEIAGRNVADYRLPSQDVISRDMQHELLQTGAPVTREMLLPPKDRPMNGMVTIFPVRGAAGNITRIGGIIIDVSDLHQAREQLDSTRETLHQSEKLAALGQLLAGVAHELNNPLAIVLGRAAMLQEKLVGTPHENPLLKLREAADRCARIVKTFLAMARQTGPRRSAVQINLLVDGALEMTSYGLRKANITLQQELDAALPEIEADEDQIIQVLINLIMNAQQALTEHEGDRRIMVRTSHDKKAEKVSFEVADNGPGVPQDKASRVFEPFFTTKAVGEGTGLGLSMCKGMVEAHGGTLTLHPTKGGGATFRVTLPAKLLNTRQADESATSSPKATRGKLLIVDDEPEIAAILADCLESVGFESDIATDGAAALEKIDRTLFDAIFCDVSMPGMDGVSMYRRLLERNPVLAKKLVFVSGDVLHRDWEKLRKSVDRPIIEKPFDPEQIRKIALELTGGAS